MRTTTCLLLLAIAGVPTASSAQAIRGIVVAERTFEPVEGAMIVAIAEDGDSIGTETTNADGFFSVTVDATGEFVLHVTALGYYRHRTAPFLLEERADVRVVEIALQPQPIAIEGIDVSTERRVAALEPTGFYERMATRRGQFLTPDDIADTNARVTHEVFLGLDHVIPQYGTPFWLRTVQFISAGKGNCTPWIWVDGVRWRWRLPGEGLDDLVPLYDLIAAEVYWGPFQAPAQFQGTAMENQCGAVLLWTRGSRDE